MRCEEWRVNAAEQARTEDILAITIISVRLKMRREEQRVTSKIRNETTVNELPPKMEKRKACCMRSSTSH